MLLYQTLLFRDERREEIIGGGVSNAPMCVIAAGTWICKLRFPLTPPIAVLAVDYIGLFPVAERLGSALLVLIWNQVGPFGSTQTDGNAMVAARDGVPVAVPEDGDWAFAATEEHGMVQDNLELLDQVQTSVTPYLAIDPALRPARLSPLIFIVMTALRTGVHVMCL